ncbi:uncharacterized protein V2V93DRAFT_383337 [Kockiozyma suomiensis]|uniref:uncharacterized protein n=1 Tax=Kockiozyma suomiensis TaxID=1337062 RepID=UPI003343D020
MEMDGNQLEAMKLKDQGNGFFREKKYVEAITSYTSAITTLKPETNAVFYSNRAACYIALEKYDLAIEDCLAALAKDSSHVKSLERCAHCYSKVGRLKEAIIERLALKVVTGDITTFMNEVIERSTSRTESAMGKLVNQYVSLEAQKLADDKTRLVFPDASEMYSHFELMYRHPQLLSFNSEDSIWKDDSAQNSPDHHLAAIYSKMKEHSYDSYVEAFYMVDRLIASGALDNNDNSKSDIFSIREQAYELRGSFNYLLKHEEDAIADYKRADNNSSRIMLKLATAVGNAEEKVKYLQKAEDADPADPQVQFFQGLMNYERADYKTALTYFDKMRRLAEAAGDTENIMYDIFWVLANWRNGDKTGSIRLLSKMEKKWASNPRFISMLANIKGDGASTSEKVQLWRDAWESVKAARQVNHVTDTTPLMNIASLLTNQLMEDISKERVSQDDNSRWQAIESVNKEAIKEDPHSLQCVFSYAYNLSFQRDRNAEAQIYFDKAFNLAAGHLAISKVLKASFANEAKLFLNQRYPEQEDLIDMMLVAEDLRTDF